MAGQPRTPVAVAEFDQCVTVERGKLANWDETIAFIKSIRKQAKRQWGDNPVGRPKNEARHHNEDMSDRATGEREIDSGCDSG